jgi:hypothetical protein
VEHNRKDVAIFAVRIIGAQITLMGVELLLLVMPDLLLTLSLPEILLQVFRYFIMLLVAMLPHSLHILMVVILVQLLQIVNVSAVVVHRIHFQILLFPAVCPVIITEDRIPFQFVLMGHLAFKERLSHLPILPVWACCRLRLPLQVPVRTRFAAALPPYQ